MAEFCSEECKITGAMCNYCDHYIDDVENDDIELNDLGNTMTGCGICRVSNKRTYTDSGFGCDNFKCIQLSMDSTHKEG